MLRQDDYKIMGLRYTVFRAAGGYKENFACLVYVMKKIYIFTRKKVYIGVHACNHRSRRIWNSDEMGTYIKFQGSQPGLHKHTIFRNMLHVATALPICNLRPCQIKWIQLEGD